MSCVQQEHKKIRNARVAQLVERDLAKVEAAGSSPVSRFLKRYPIGYLFFRLKTWTRGAAEFEVSEDIKPSSVGANHWSSRPIAPSRAFFACRKLRRFPFVVCSIFQVTTLRIVFFLLYYYEYEKNKIYDVEGMSDLFIFYGTKY